MKYDSYGNVISESNPTFKSRHRFTGREFDSETGLQYYRARYYDSSTGRFVSEDPIGFASGDVNEYRYVSNTPANAVDPSGEKIDFQGAINKIRNFFKPAGKAKKKLENAQKKGKELAEKSKEVADIAGWDPFQF